MGGPSVFCLFRLQTSQEVEQLIRNMIAYGYVHLTWEHHYSKANSQASGPLGQESWGHCRREQLWKRAEVRGMDTLEWKNTVHGFCWH